MDRATTGRVSGEMVDAADVTEVTFAAAHSGVGSLGSVAADGHAGSGSSRRQVEARVTLLPTTSLPTPQNARGTNGFNAHLGVVGRPMTRSMARMRDSLGRSPGSSTLFSRLQGVAKSSGRAKRAGSRLEDSSDLRHREARAGLDKALATSLPDGGGMDNEDDEDDDDEEADEDEDGDDHEDEDEEEDDDVEDNVTEAPLPAKTKEGGSILRRSITVRHAKPSRRSARIMAMSEGAKQAETLPPKGKLASSSKVRSSSPRKKRKVRMAVSGKPPRRSARLAKAPTSFHKYPELPPELKLCVWEFYCATTPRLVYLRNRAMRHHTPGDISMDIQNVQPDWFNVDVIARHVADRAYTQRFVLHSPPSSASIQLINTDIDIVAFEACCSGCRGYHCSRAQFNEDDRRAVRYIAVQTESPLLTPMSLPCWVTISTAWASVETIYLVDGGLTGDLRGHDKALIRIEEGDRETALRTQFNTWKKQGGAMSKLTTLEFVVSVDRDWNEADDPKKRYQHVSNRKTGLPEDIVVG